MGKLDIKGERYGALVAISPTEIKKNNATCWLFQCDCGRQKILPMNQVRYGSIKSCGCKINANPRKPRSQRVEVGQTYGSLKVIKLMGKSEDKHFMSKVRCICGHEFVIRDTFLICGTRTQCPVCSNNDRITHGLSDTPIYCVWHGMKDRCYNPKNKSFHNYGGRGISVCDEWMSSDAFIEWAIENGWEEGLQLDRINTDGNYEPNNCRFVTQLENARNRRNTLFIHYEGKLLTIGEVAEITGLRHELIYQRIHKFGWNEYDATHIIPDSHYFTTQKMRRTTLTDIRTGEKTRFDSCSKASKFLGRKTTYLLSASYRKGNSFTCDNYIVEIEDTDKDMELCKA